MLILFLTNPMSAFFPLIIVKFRTLFHYIRNPIHMVTCLITQRMFNSTTSTTSGIDLADAASLTDNEEDTFRPASLSSARYFPSEMLNDRCYNFNKCDMHNFTTGL